MKTPVEDMREIYLREKNSFVYMLLLGRLETTNSIMYKAPHDLVILMPRLHDLSEESIERSMKDIRNQDTKLSVPTHKNEIIID